LRELVSILSALELVLCGGCGAVPTNQAESARALSAGLTFGITIALFAAGGIWLDKKLASGPWFAVAGALVGLLGGTIHLLLAIAPGVLPFGPKSASRPGRGTEDDARRTGSDPGQHSGPSST
jgi:F0F1-type ATP synthase assembly protein I